MGSRQHYQLRPLYHHGSLPTGLSDGQALNRSLPFLAPREQSHHAEAGGDYLGKEIRVQTESEGTAVKRWRETASTTVATERESRK